MKRYHKLFLYFKAFIFLLPACGQKSFEEKVEGMYRYTVPLIKSEQLKQSMTEKTQLFLLDIRSPEEYRVSHLPEARLINYADFSKEQVRDIPKEAPIVVYCSVGYRSERIGEELQDMGYTDVKNLYGGIFDWKNNGNKVVNINNQPTDSVHTYNRRWGQWLYNGIKVYE